MENQKIINLLNKSDTSSRHFATKKWYVIDENKYKLWSKQTYWCK